MNFDAGKDQTSTCKKTKIISLADAFETFNETCNKKDKLFTGYFVPLLRYIRDAGLKNPKKKQKKTQKAAWFSIFENVVRGGISGRKRKD